MLVNVFTGKSVYAQKARDFVTFILDLVTNHDKFKGCHLNDIDSLFNLVISGKLDERVMYNSHTRVKLSTVHEAKGKEWDSVYIWNDIEGTFPASVGNRELTEEEFEEERRVHYIAFTRARSKLTIFTKDTMRGTFLNECNLELTGVEQTDMKNQSVTLSGNVVDTGIAKMVKKYITDNLELFFDDKMDRNKPEWLALMRLTSTLSSGTVSNMLFDKVMMKLSELKDFNTKAIDDKLFFLGVAFLQVLEEESE
jgi:hypothetical protein